MKHNIGICKTSGLFLAIALGSVLPLSADQVITGDLDVSGDIDFGTTNVTPATSAVGINYLPTTLTARFILTPDNGKFVWRQNGIDSGNTKTKMLLDGDNSLKLYSTAGAVNIVLNPNNGQINMFGTGSGIYSNGTAVFTRDSSGNMVFASDSFINGIRLGRGAGNESTNTAVGASALAVNTVGANNNTSVGYSSLGFNTTGDCNTAYGSGSLKLNTTGSWNAAFGSNTLACLSSGGQNTAIGHAAFINLTTGSRNTALGENAGRYIGIPGTDSLTSTTDGIYVGYAARPLNDGNINSIVIGANAVGEGSNTAVIGNSSIISTRLFGQTQLDSLNVTNGTVLNGSVTLSVPQGDISMGAYAN